MKASKLYQLYIIIGIIFFISCSSNKEEEECMKTVTIPQFYTVGDHIYRYDVEQEVPCDAVLITEPVNIEPPLLEGFTYEVLRFEYTSDTGNNTSRLEFEIKLNNPNNYSVQGIPYFTLSSDDVVYTTNYANLLKVPCTTLNANSSCTVTLDLEENRAVGFPSSLELVTVKYYLTE
ncbi:hypothetical protein V1T75_14285 [Tenacibaculum sp. FZY0031]|uniref:hypothetical protein n=1 Tax=Tenacibaculum sp. FZY0031 TaxID=3116648 RepID=UPI002EA4A2FA|nr:hypothetical protein [Tenacibaculum sp. FZY0031]